jgi:hypothetical protein
VSCPASDPRVWRRGRSRHRWSCRRSRSPRSEFARRTRRLRARLRVDTCGRIRFTNRTETCRATLNVFPAEASRLQTQIQASHHRTLHAGAVLGVVNALRYASTRPSAGPSGIDDASARHVSGTYAMVLSLSITQAGLTRRARRRMLASSRQCRTALPPFASRANGARIRSAPTGHHIERNP